MNFTCHSESTGIYIYFTVSLPHRNTPGRFMFPVTGGAALTKWHMAVKRQQGPWRVIAWQYVVTLQQFNQEEGLSAHIHTNTHTHTHMAHVSTFCADGEGGVPQSLG